MQSTQLTPFCFGENLVRVFADDNGDPWFVAKDVAKALEYPETTISNMNKAIQHVPDEWKGRYPIPTPSGIQEMLTLSEQGLYFFLGRSDKPKALPFQKWLAGEVVPSIRKTGRYEKLGRKAADIELPAEMPQEALALKPAMRQKLIRDAIRLASLDSGDSARAIHWFAELCKTVAAAPAAPPSGYDKVRAFYYQRCQPAPGVKTRSSTLYEAFRRWHSGQSGNLPSRKIFGSCMKEFARYCRSNGSVFEGVCLK